MKQSIVVKATAILFCLSFAVTSVDAQRVVVSHDEWMTQYGYFNTNEQQFVANALDWFGLSSGNILLYSSNHYLVNAPFQAYLTSLGYTVTQNAAPASFGGYDAVFSEGVTNLDGSGLASYASGGGNVFYFGGTGIGGAGFEAAYSNLFLNAVGLSFRGTYNGVGTVNTSGFAAQGLYGASLFTGVSRVYGNNGNNIDEVGAAGWTTQLFRDGRGNGVYAAATAMPSSAVPEPATVVLLASGLIGLGFLHRRRRRLES